MVTKKKIFLIPAAIIAAVLLSWLSLFVYFQVADWGFCREVPFTEQLERLCTVHTAEHWLGSVEGFEEHREILEIYNNHKPLAQGYAVTAEDSWCAAFASCIAIERRLTDITPTECSCERQIGLWQQRNCWIENDNYMPLPGDYIYYNWDVLTNTADNTGWSDHVGIVVGTAGPFIKVIEGNKDDMVSYRIVMRGDCRIRGFGLPDYAAKLA